MIYFPDVNDWNDKVTNNLVFCFDHNEKLLVLDAARPKTHLS